jgi:hypothetical protein
MNKVRLKTFAPYWQANSILRVRPLDQIGKVLRQERDALLQWRHNAS